MDDRKKFVGNFLTEHFSVYLNQQLVDTISAGGWAPYEEIMDAAALRLTEKINAGERILTRYINIDKREIMFWTYKNDEWFTL